MTRKSSYYLNKQINELTDKAVCIESQIRQISHAGNFKDENHRRLNMSVLDYCESELQTLNQRLDALCDQLQD